MDALYGLEVLDVLHARSSNESVYVRIEAKGSLGQKRAIEHLLDGHLNVVHKFHCIVIRL